MRTTEKQLRGMFERLARISGLPLVLNCWRPGDGTARYQLAVLEPGGTAESNLGAVWHGRSEAYYALELASQVVAQTLARRPKGRSK